MSFGETFLTTPDLFPARRAGEAWGGETIELTVAGGPYRCTGLDPRQAEAARDHFRDYVREDSGASGPEVRLFRVAPEEFREFDLAGWEYSLDFDYQPAAVRLAGLRFMGRLEWRPSLAGAVWTPEAHGDRFVELFENFLRVLTSYRLLETGGVMLHSAGVESGGRARIFFGRSGAGKTTLSRKSLAAGRRVLSDDINAVRPVEDEPASPPTVEPMPFAGDLGRTGEPGEAFPLAGIYRLEKAEPEVLGPSVLRPAVLEPAVLRPAVLKPLAPAPAVAALTACTPFVNRDPHRADSLARALERLVAQVPCHVLSSTLEGDVWSLLESDPPEEKRG